MSARRTMYGRSEAVDPPPARNLDVPEIDFSRSSMVLRGIDPILTGALLAHLDAMDNFYEAAASAYLIVRTGETRIFANALLRKGVVT
jgi:RbsD / FucU transport protein family